MAASDAAARAIDQIKTRLHTIFGDKIDLSDLNGKSEPDRENHYLTRALTALYVKGELPISLTASTKCPSGDFVNRTNRLVWRWA